MSADASGPIWGTHRLSECPLSSCEVDVEAGNLRTPVDRAREERRETLTQPVGVLPGGEVDWQAIVRWVIEQLGRDETTSVTALGEAVDLVGGRVSRAELVGNVLRLRDHYLCRVGTDGALIESGRIYPIAGPGPDGANVPWRVKTSGPSWRHRS